jgi:hypothetical protein
MNTLVIDAKKSTKLAVATAGPSQELRREAPAERRRLDAMWGTHSNENS